MSTSDPGHYTLFIRMISPKKSAAYALASEIHYSQRFASVIEKQQAVERLKTHDPKLGEYVASELRAYHDPVQ